MSKAAYDADLYAWTRAQAEALRAENWSALDLTNLAEEFASLGSEQEHVVESHLTVLLTHLLKWRYEPERRGKSWRNSILVARQQIAKRLRRSPSLRPKLPKFLAEAYTDARRRAAMQTELPLATFPETCPWEVVQILDTEYWPEENPT